MNPDKIGKFIYILRTEKKWSQYQLADMIPISRQAVSKWERGQTIPDSSTLLKLSEIFDVTINELLNGERLKIDSIKELEVTTLNLVDESNKKTKRIKKNLIIYSTIIGILLFLFLAYYFINSYNTIKVYTIYGEGEHFRVYDGLFVSTNQRTYFKIGELKADKDIKIENIKLYYRQNGKDKIISEDIGIDRMIVDFQGYSLIFIKQNRFPTAYLEIKYNENKTDKIKLIFKREFSNNSFIFKNYKKFGEVITNKSKDLKQQGKTKKIEKEKPKEESKKEETTEEKLEEKKENLKEETKSESEEETIEQTLNEEESTTEEIEPVNELEKIDIIKEKGVYENGSYNYIIENENSTIEFTYFSLMNQLVMYEEEQIVWTYMVLPKLHFCEKKEAESQDLSHPENCKNYVLETLGKYVK